MNDQVSTSGSATPDALSTSDLIDRFGLDLPDQTQIAHDLLQRYDEPHRRYHDRRHLAAVLSRIDQLATEHNDLFLVRMAAWFHDAVYAIPSRQVSNEEASARLALSELSRCGLEQEDLGEIARLIRLTATHQANSMDQDGALLCDADLAILSADLADYRDYVAGVRAEYRHADDDHFARGRLRVLRTLGGQTLFHTRGGRKLESAAQTNLLIEAYELIDQIGAAGPDPSGDSLTQEDWPLTHARPTARAGIHPLPRANPG